MPGGLSGRHEPPEMRLGMVAMGDDDVLERKGDLCTEDLDQSGEVTPALRAEVIYNESDVG
jgi:hypothetical protein